MVEMLSGLEGGRRSRRSSDDVITASKGMAENQLPEFKGHPFVTGEALRMSPVMSMAGLERERRQAAVTMAFEPVAGTINWRGRRYQQEIKQELAKVWWSELCQYRVKEKEAWLVAKSSSTSILPLENVSGGYEVVSCDSVTTSKANRNSGCEVTDKSANVIIRRKIPKSRGCCKFRNCPSYSNLLPLLVQLDVNLIYEIALEVRGFILHAVKGLKQSLRRYWREVSKPSFESHNCTHVDQAVEASETYNARV
ncbi:hypothetical protein L2E82_39543 [Cichorium intybus]|uniref:Uncharacterized protein n=1 Tax=Cichorium intybus TaxID=13427 RepID=A0ACB9AHU4_CICIN|nr:hypothetical protein L2E82_39543 [Cichorium intybus]